LFSEKIISVVKTQFEITKAEFETKEKNSVLINQKWLEISSHF